MNWNVVREHATWLTIVVLAMLTACDGDSRRPAAKLNVAVSIVPQAWLVAAIGGTKVKVITLIEPGYSPETYQPEEARITELMRAKAYFRIGVPFENGAWLQAVKQLSSVVVVDLRKGITLRRTDPHIWLSPPLLKRQAQAVADALSDLDPQHRTTYQANLIKVQTLLDETDAALRRKLAPIKGKAFLVLHPSWGYFATTYELQQIAIEIDGQQPSDHELTQIIAAARRNGVKVLFVDPHMAGNTATAVAEALGARVEPLDPLAWDVPANLLHVADALRASYE